MKKMIIIAVAVWAGMFASAQDTVHYGDPYYWFLTDSIHGMDSMTWPIPGNIIGENGYNSWAGTYNLMYVPDSTVPVVGIAVTPNRRTVEDTSVNYTVMIYGRKGVRDSIFDGFWLLDSVRRSERQSCFFLYESYQSSGYHSYVAPTEEFYFDSIIYVSDTFFIGMGSTSYSYMGGAGVVFGGVLTPSLCHNNNMYVQFPVYDGFHVSENGPYRIHWFGDWGVLFPIVDFRCYSRVEKPYLAGASADSLIIAWEDRGVELYEVAVGLNGTPVDSAFLTFTTPDTRVTLDSLLEHDVTYSVWVRCMCHYSGKNYNEVRWGPWSRGLNVKLLNAGIGGLLLDIDLTLSPNPAKGAVRLECGEPMLGIEVLDMAGRTVSAESGIRSSELTLDIHALPAGVYTVRVTTATGTALRRLAVE